MKIGKYGEKIALKYLKNKGFNIRHTNYHSQYGEIDIICENESFVVFVEVKSKLHNSQSTLFERINNSKKAKIIKTIYDYSSKHQIDKQPRIDVIEIEIFEIYHRIKHTKNAFEANYGFF